MKSRFRSAFGYDVEAASKETAISFEGQESLTVQSMAEDADINVIMERFGITGSMPSNPKIPMYGDFTDVKDFQTALNAVVGAYEGFMELPAKVRDRFNNNPQELLEFCADDANIEEARKLGLLKESTDGQSSAGRGPGGSVEPTGGTARDSVEEVSGQARGGKKAS